MVDQAQHQRMEGVQIAYPERPGQPDCVYYLHNGQCGYGQRCRFNHPPLSSNAMQCADQADRKLPKRLGQPDCQYFMRTGACNFGAACKYHHPQDRVGSQVQLSISDLPMGLCRKNNHSSTVMIPGSPVYAWHAYSSSNLLSSFHGARPAYVMAPRVSYLHSQQAPSPTSYTPIVLSPQWTYKGSHSLQTLVTDGLDQIASENNKTTYVRGDSVITYSKSRASAVHEDEFPEREGQPECQYYLKTGDCRFRALCKFHHPKAGTARVLPAKCALSVIGLPLRAGEPHCSYYMRYGICKFGPVCKFDHPILVPLYNAMGVAPVYNMRMSTTHRIPGANADSTVWSSCGESVHAAEQYGPDSLRKEVEHDASTTVSAREGGEALETEL